MKEFPNLEAANGRKRDLLAGKKEAMQSESRHQLTLAAELFTRDHQSESVHVGDADFRNRAFDYWVDKKYAKAFRDLINHPDFKSKEQYRLNGDVFNVTLSDVEFFLHNNELPER